MRFLAHQCNAGGRDLGSRSLAYRDKGKVEVARFVDKIGVMNSRCLHYSSSARGRVGDMMGSTERLRDISNSAAQWSSGYSGDILVIYRGTLDCNVNQLC